MTTIFGHDPALGHLRSSTFAPGDTVASVWPERDRISHDAERRRDLMAKSITIIPVAKTRVLCAAKTAAFARTLDSKMQRRIRTSIEDAADRRIALRKGLFR